MVEKRKKVVALLPMKANSERVKGKNFRDFNGKPLFRWILDSLLRVEEITQVVINTDARKILEEHGLFDSEKILIRDRKPEICGDYVSMNLILEDDIQNVEADIFLMTHTTNPLLSEESIKGALKAFILSPEKDSLFTVDKIQTRFYRENATAVNHDPENLVRTQDLEPWFEENSNLYIFTKESFKSTNARIGLKPMMYTTPKLESIDIDNPEDWDFAQAVSAYLMKKEN